MAPTSTALETIGIAGLDDVLGGGLNFRARPAARAGSRRYAIAPVRK